MIKVNILYIEEYLPKILRIRFIVLQLKIGAMHDDV